MPDPVASKNFRNPFGECQPMRIVFVQSGLTAGGTEKIVNLLARHRADIGDEVHVLAFRGTREDSYFHYDDDISVSTQTNNSENTRNKFLRVGSRLNWLRRKFQKIRPDVIISLLTKTNAIALVASRGLGIPVIISERNNPGKQGASFIWQKAIKLLAPWAARVVVQTDSARQEVSANVQSKTTIIPNPSVIFSEIERTKNAGHRIVAAGRLSHQKGFDLLLEAFAIIAPKVPQANLTIFGDGPDREALIAHAETLAISNRVSFPGITKKPGAWLAEADIFVISSRYEGFPNVLIESLAAGLPTVAYACPWGPSDILTNEKDGLLVEAENVPALATAIHRLLADEKLREKFSITAPETAKRFDLRTVLTQWDSVINHALLEEKQ
jgi:glycosyltransferase involved in cell wall biosynthesis